MRLMLILLLVLCTAQESYYKDTDEEWTDWDEHWKYECDDALSAMVNVRSMHNNNKEDRIWKFDCAPVAAAGSADCVQESWTSYKASFFTETTCPTSHPWLHAFESEHDNGQEDRVWRVNCCSMGGVPLVSTEYIRNYNDMDDEFYINAWPRFIIGIGGDYANAQHDRNYHWAIGTPGFNYGQNNPPAQPTPYGTDSEDGYTVWNDFREHLVFECEFTNQAINWIWSRHRNDKEDRNWAFECGQFTMDDFGYTLWSDYLADFDDDIDYECPTGFLCGLDSYWNSATNDRKWHAKCCYSVSDNGVVAECGSWTSANSWDGDVSVQTNYPWFFAGLHSEHDNGKEDRQWQFLKCKSEIGNSYCELELRNVQLATDASYEFELITTKGLDCYDDDAGGVISCTDTHLMATCDGINDCTIGTEISNTYSTEIGSSELDATSTQRTWGQETTVSWEATTTALGGKVSFGMSAGYGYDWEYVETSGTEEGWFETETSTVAVQCEGTINGDLGFTGYLHMQADYVIKDFDWTGELYGRSCDPLVQGSYTAWELVDSAISGIYRDIKVFTCVIEAVWPEDENYEMKTSDQCGDDYVIDSIKACSTAAAAVEIGSVFVGETAVVEVVYGDTPADTTPTGCFVSNQQVFWNNPATPNTGECQGAQVCLCYKNSIAQREAYNSAHGLLLQEYEDYVEEMVNYVTDDVGHKVGTETTTTLGNYLNWVDREAIFLFRGSFCPTSVGEHYFLTRATYHVMVFLNDELIIESSNPSGSTEETIEYAYTVGGDLNAANPKLCVPFKIYYGTPQSGGELTFAYKVPGWNSYQTDLSLGFFTIYTEDCFESWEQYKTCSDDNTSLTRLHAGEDGTLDASGQRAICLETCSQQGYTCCRINYYWDPPKCWGGMETTEDKNNANQWATDVCKTDTVETTTSMATNTDSGTLTTSEKCEYEKHCDNCWCSEITDDDYSWSGVSVEDCAEIAVNYNKDVFSYLASSGECTVTHQHLCELADTTNDHATYHITDCYDCAVENYVEIGYSCEMIAAEFGDSYTLGCDCPMMSECELRQICEDCKCEGVTTGSSDSSYNTVDKCYEAAIEAGVNAFSFRSQTSPYCNLNYNMNQCVPQNLADGTSNDWGIWYIDCEDAVAAPLKEEGSEEVIKRHSESERRRMWVAAGEWTEYDDEHYMECDANYAITGVQSVFNSGKGDRVFRYACTDTGAYETNRYTTGWVNSYKDDFTSSCAANELMCGIRSYHDNSKEDRLYEYYCCTYSMADDTFDANTDCSWTNDENSIEHEPHAYSTYPKFFRGLSSDFDNEDRVWKYRWCSTNVVYPRPEPHVPWYTDRSTDNNDWDEWLFFECAGSDQAINYIQSTHDDGKEDRLWQFGCGIYTEWQTSDSYWTRISDYDNEINKSCNDGFICGFSSFHNNGKEDRRWRFKCCNQEEYGTTRADTSGTVGPNTWDDPVNVDLDYPKYISGVYSVHDNGKEDRQWTWTWHKTALSEKICQYQVIPNSYYWYQGDDSSDTSILSDIQCKMDDGTYGAACGTVNCISADRCSMTIEIHTEVSDEIFSDSFTEYETMSTHALVGGFTVGYGIETGIPVIGQTEVEWTLESDWYRGWGDGTTTSSTDYYAETVSENWEKSCEGGVSPGAGWSATMSVTATVEKYTVGWDGTLQGIYCDENGQAECDDGTCWNDLGTTSGYIEDQYVFNCEITSDFGFADSWYVESTNYCDVGATIETDVECLLAIQGSSFDLQIGYEINIEEDSLDGYSKPTGCYVSNLSGTNYAFFNNPNSDSPNSGSCSGTMVCLCRTSAVSTVDGLYEYVYEGDYDEDIDAFLPANGWTSTATNLKTTIQEIAHVCDTWVQSASCLETTSSLQRLTSYESSMDACLTGCKNDGYTCCEWDDSLSTCSGGSEEITYDADTDDIWALTTTNCETNFDSCSSTPYCTYCKCQGAKGSTSVNLSTEDDCYDYALAQGVDAFSWRTMPNTRCNVQYSQDDCEYQAVAYPNSYDWSIHYITCGYSKHYSGLFCPTELGTYTFKTVSSDAVTLVIDGVEKIAQSSGTGQVSHTVATMGCRSFSLYAGSKNDAQYLDFSYLKPDSTVWISDLSQEFYAEMTSSSRRRLLESQMYHFQCNGNHLCGDTEECYISEEYSACIDSSVLGGKTGIGQTECASSDDCAGDYECHVSDNYSVCLPIDFLQNIVLHPCETDAECDADQTCYEWLYSHDVGKCIANTELELYRYECGDAYGADDSACSTGYKCYLNTDEQFSVCVYDSIDTSTFVFCNTDADCASDSYCEDYTFFNLCEAQAVVEEVEETLTPTQVPTEAVVVVPEHPLESYDYMSYDTVVEMQQEAEVQEQVGVTKETIVEPTNLIHPLWVMSALGLLIIGLYKYINSKKSEEKMPLLGLADADEV